MITVRTRTPVWSHKLYVKPQTMGERIALRRKGYKVWNQGWIRGYFWVKEEHYNDPTRA